MKTAIFGFLFLFASFVSAQDVHYTMFSFASASLNPGLTGIYEHDHPDADFRFFTNYRNQWRSIQSQYSESLTPFATYSISADYKLRWLRVLKHNCIGLGAMAYKDKSGDLNFSTTQYAWNASFQKVVGKMRRDFLTIGIQQSIVQRSLDFSDASYDAQWTGSYYDPQLPSGENLPTPQFYYQDVNAGISYVHRPIKKGSYWMLGFASFHLNRPQQSFYNNLYELTLKRKWLLHGSAKIELKNAGYILYPVGLLMKQGQASEGNLTLFAGKKVANKDLQVRIGAGYRFVGSYNRNLSSDALLMAIWLLYHQWDFGFSYDTNFSGLTNATRLKGGVEVFLIYHQQFFRHKSKYHKFRYKMPECPDDYQY